jgi:hypothetical protein
MAVKCDPDRFPVDELIDSLVIGEVMSLKKVMDTGHIGQLPGPVDLPAIDSLCFDDSVRIAEGEWQWRTVKVNNHSGDGCINISRDAIFVSEYDTGIGIAIIPEIIISNQ